LKSSTLTLSRRSSMSTRALSNPALLQMQKRFKRLPKKVSRSSMTTWRARKELTTPTYLRAKKTL